MFHDTELYDQRVLRKVNIIVIGNVTHGGDMSLHEMLYSFTGKNFSPETILLSSRDFDVKAPDGNLREPRSKTKAR